LSVNVRNFDLVSLRSFVATAEEGSLAKAAARQHIALSAISRRVSELEALAGVQLFERHDRGMTLTAAGTLLLARLHNVFDQLEAIALDLDGFRTGTRGHVRIHAHMSATAGILPEQVASFLVAYPGIEVEVDEFTSLEVIHSIRIGAADLGLVSGTLEAEDVSMLPWHCDELVAILPRGHALARRPKLTLADMLEEPFVGMQRDSALLTLCRNHARSIGKHLHERVHATSFDSVRRMVGAGLGVAILPASSTCSKDSKTEVRPLVEPWARHSLMLCVRNPTQMSTATKLMIDHLLEGKADFQLPLKSARSA
jgi:DNA-binding transcriptional LysR family regulator